MFTLLLLAVGLVVVLAMFPSIRAWFFAKFKITSPAISTILDDIESKIDDLISHTDSTKLNRSTQDGARAQNLADRLKVIAS